MANARATVTVVASSMPLVAEIDRQKLFIPEQPALDSVVRGTIVYLMLFIVMRFFLKRQSGGLGMADVLVVVLIADAVQNAMGSEYRSVTEGVLLVLTIVFWDCTLDWLGHRFPSLRRITRPSPLLLIEDGKLLYHNMRQKWSLPTSCSQSSRSPNCLLRNIPNDRR